jgi:uncharacterized protein YjbJ (UPF0337 family)
VAIVANESRAGQVNQIEVIMANDDKRPDGSVSEEAAAFGQRVKGAVKDGVGATTGNESLEHEGERDNAEGRERQRRNDVFDESRPGSQNTSIREETGAVAERMKGAAKDAAGAVLGDERLEREGERENAEGRKRQAQNDAIGGNRPRPSDATWSSKNLVTGLYDTPDAAGKAYQDLTNRHGYGADDISVVMSDETRKRHFSGVKPGQEFEEGSKAAEGAGIGGGIGLGVGAALGALVAAATAIAIPGLGLVVAGPIAGAIAGAGAGGATGTLVGALIGAGIPENRAAEYERGLKEGGIVLGTRAKDETHATELERDFTGYGARNVLR